MLIRTGYSKQHLDFGELFALTFTQDGYPMPVGISDTPCNRRELHARGVIFFSNVTLRQAANAYVLQGLRSGEYPDVISVVYTTPVIPRGAQPLPADNDYFNYADTTTPLAMCIDHQYRAAVVGLLMLECISPLHDNFSSIIDDQEVVYWTMAE